MDDSVEKGDRWRKVERAASPSEIPEQTRQIGEAILSTTDVHLLRRYLDGRHPGTAGVAITGRLVKSFAKRHLYPALIEIKTVVISDDCYLHG